MITIAISSTRSPFRLQRTVMGIMIGMLVLVGAYIAYWVGPYSRRMRVLGAAFPVAQQYLADVQHGNWAGAQKAHTDNASFGRAEAQWGAITLKYGKIEAFQGTSAHMVHVALLATTTDQSYDVKCTRGTAAVVIHLVPQGRSRPVWRVEDVRMQ